MGLAERPLRARASPLPARAVEFNDESWKPIAYYAYKASSDLAAERGTYSSYQAASGTAACSRRTPRSPRAGARHHDRSAPRRQDGLDPLREKIAKQGMRNSNVLAIAPTATISNIMGTAPASSRTTRTSTSNRTSPATSSCSIRTSYATSKGPRPLEPGNGRSAQVLRR